MPSAFVSHSSPDDRYVQEMVQYLRTLGYDDVFNDGHSIEPDELFWNRIEQGIRECDAFVVILSHASVSSYWVDREVQFAREQGKSVIPVRIDDCKLPPSFDGRDVIDLRLGRGDKVKIAPSRITKHSPKILFGRDHWLDALDAAWANPRLNVYTLVAWGGVGKTSLLAHWVSQRMAAKGWPGVERYFDWSFYSQGTGESRQTSSDLFVQEALSFFDDPDPTKGSPWERGERLAGLVRRHRTLLVLDGIEPLQYPVNDPQAGRLKDQALEALLHSLAADNPGLCIVTTREHLKNIESHATTEEQKLDKLVKEAAIELLRHLQVVGTEAEMEAAWKDAGGHALTLQLLGRFLADAHGGDIRRYKEVKFEEADLERQGRSAFKVMIAYERWLSSAGPERQRELALLRLTGLFDRPMSRDCLQALRAEPAIPGLTDKLVKLKDAQWNVAEKRLADVDLLTVTPDAIDAHPLIREYFAKQLRHTQPAAFQAAHSRLFDHLCETTPYRPDTLDGLQPLYQAVVHGCLAGRQQEACRKVYVDRILRGTGSDGFYSWKKLGTIGADLAAVAAFFEEPWSSVSPNLSEADKAWLLNQDALYLRALGRSIEALQPMRAGLETYVQQKEWKFAAICASNLSELEVTLGRLTEAVADARQSISHADQSGDAFWRMASHTTAADALHRSGRRAEAGSLFAEAERMQKEMQPEFDLLYSLPGFQYCDWLLAPAERSAWQVLVPGTGLLSVTNERGEDGPATICDEVERRAATTLSWAASQHCLLDIALDHLTLARVALVRGILSHLLPQPTLDLPNVSAAVNGLRDAGTTHHLPKGLLTAALYYFVRGDAAPARAALDQAQEIADRGPMPLYLADIHLHRARLFHDQDELANARDLIEKHGYWRRKEELEDAEAAARDWQA
jgi:TIR domain